MGNEDRDEDFTAFVRAQSAALMKVAFLLTGDRGLAEDLLQTSLDKASRRWPAIEEPAAAYARPASHAAADPNSPTSGNPPRGAAPHRRAPPTDLACLFGGGRSTVYRSLERAGAPSSTTAQHNNSQLAKIVR